MAKHAACLCVACSISALSLQHLRAQQVCLPLTPQGNPTCHNLDNWPGWLQVLKLFPSAARLKNTWHSIVKIGQSLYREAPGMDVFRPDQETPVRRFYMAGSFTKQVSVTNIGFPGISDVDMLDRASVR